MDTVTVSPKFQVVIPLNIRERLKILPGEKVVVMEKDGVIQLVRIEGIMSLKGKFNKVLSEGIRDERDRTDS